MILLIGIPVTELNYFYQNKESYDTKRSRVQLLKSDILIELLWKNV